MITSRDYLIKPGEAAAGLGGHTLPGTFAAAVAASGDAAAVFEGDRFRSWSRWDAESAALARGLQDLGIRPGDVVAVWLPNCWEFLTAHVALAMIGAVQLPVHMSSGAQEARPLLARTAARALVLPAAHRGRELLSVGTRLRQDVPSVRHLLVCGTVPAGVETTSVIPLAALTAQWLGSRPSEVRVLPDDPLVAMPSSGTTSDRPKICLHSHDGLVSNAAMVARQGRAGMGDTTVSASPFTHLFGMLSVHLSLFSRGRQALLPAWDVGDLVDVARGSGATVLFAVPAQLRDLVAKLPDDAGIRLREVRTGGAAVPGGLVTDLASTVGARVIVQWGMSEVGAGTFTLPDDAPDVAVTSIGRPVEAAEARIIGENGLVAEADQVGQLQYRGPYMFRGYLGDADLTAAAITEDGWLRTGDLASRNADGTIAFRGRDVELIDVGGVKFSALEVERVLAEMPEFDTVAVIGRRDPRLGQYPCLVATLRPGMTITLDAVIAKMADAELASHKWPAELIIRDAIPLTPTGKVARGRLADTLAGTSSEAAAPSAPARAEERTTRERRVEQIVKVIRERMAAVSDRPLIEREDLDQAFRDLGIDSSAAVRLATVLAEATGRPVSAGDVFEYPTPLALARHLAGETASADHDVPAPVAADDPVVVVGMGCRFPGGVRSADDLWRLVSEGRDAITTLPADRGWDPAAWYDAEPGWAGRTYTRFGGVLPDAAEFDAEFFGITPREAVAMDPQQRLLLETSWEALENAGIAPDTLRGSSTGVYVGMMASDYAPRVFEDPTVYDGHVLTGNASSVASGRIAYTLGTEGPALTIDTACSSSQVAVHAASRALRDGECSLALAGGVTVMSTPASFIEFGRQRALAPDGRCKPFAAGADGLGWGEGAGVLVLERMSDACAQGHRVLAVIRGSAINQDGRSNGLTAPSGPAQRRVIRQALGDARLTTTDVDAVEAHGTGTFLGDPIEAESLIATYGADRSGDDPLWLGSVKSNIGHTQAASGAAGLIKMVMALRHGVLPPTLHAAVPTPRVDWSGGAIALLSERTPWPDRGRPRRAAVSSFGISGTNAHVIIEEAPTDAADRNARTGPLPFILSAKDSDTLRSSAARLRAWMEERPAVPLADIGRSLATGRVRFEHRAAVVTDDRDRLLAALAALAEGRASGDVIRGKARTRRKTVFVFPGQGSQWQGMATGLLEASPVFAASVAECERALAPYVDWSLREVLTGDGGPPPDRVDVVQPVLFAMMVSLAALWRAHGVRPDAVVGHSQGEIAAACVAGILSLDDAAKTVALRARMLRELSGRGGMAAIRLPAEELAARLRGGYDGVAITAVNGPRSVVVSGDASDVGRLVAELTAEGIRAVHIPVDYASHSPYVEPLAERLTDMSSGLRPTTGRLPFYSTVDGGWIDPAVLTGDYWYRNLRATVGFDPAVRALITSGHDLFIEVSPHAVLTSAIEETAEDMGADVIAVETLRRDDGDLGRFRRSLAEAHEYGLTVDWAALFPAASARLVDLPTYPFRRTRYWLTGHTDDPAAGDRIVPVPTGPDPVRSPTSAPVADREGSVLDMIRAHTAAVSGFARAEEIAPDRNFAELGMTSLAAVELRDRLSRDVGVRLAATAVFDHPSPAALAAHLVARLATVADGPEPDRAPDTEPPGDVAELFHRLCAAGDIATAMAVSAGAALTLDSFEIDTAGDNAPSPVRIRSGSAEPVIMCLPSVVPLGGPQEYARLTLALPDKRGVIALPQPGYVAGERVPANLDALVSAQLTAIGRLSVQGPVVLCGHSSGGLAALAVAAGIEAVGGTVAGVVVLDTYWPVPGMTPDLHRTVLLAGQEHGRALGVADAGVRRIAAMGAYTKILDGWKPTQLAAPVLVVRPLDAITGTPLPAVATEWPLRHTLVETPGDHFTMMTEHATPLAAAVESWVAERV